MLLRSPRRPIRALFGYDVPDYGECDDKADRDREHRHGKRSPHRRDRTTSAATRTGSVLADDFVCLVTLHDWPLARADSHEQATAISRYDRAEKREQP